MGQVRMFEVSLEEQLACVDREISMRERVYARWVAEKRMTQKTADKEIEGMRAVRETLKQVQSTEGRS
jgi:hypothetical protein